MISNLLPCPFCGGDELSHGFEYQPERGSVQCHTCDALVVAFTEAAAIAAWNRRPTPSEQRNAVLDLAEKAAREAVARYCRGDMFVMAGPAVIGMSVVSAIRSLKVAEPSAAKDSGPSIERPEGTP